MGLLSGIFGGGDRKNPMEEANKYLDQIPGVAHKGYDPYIDEGRDASARTQEEYDRLMSDPTAMINEFMKGYKPSEGYNFQKELLTKELGNAAASGGVAGTPQDQLNQGMGIQKLLSGDMQQFLANVLGLYKTGLAGEEGVATRGYDASGKLTDAIGGALNQQGGLAFQDAQQQNQNQNGIWSMFGKALGAGAGGLLGGLPGAKIGASIF
jgi:hypothetical protein